MFWAQVLLEADVSLLVKTGTVEETETGLSDEALTNKTLQSGIAEVVAQSHLATMVKVSQL